MLLVTYVDCGEIIHEYFHKGILEELNYLGCTDLCDEIMSLPTNILCSHNAVNKHDIMGNLLLQHGVNKCVTTFAELECLYETCDEKILKNRGKYDINLLFIETIIKYASCRSYYYDLLEDYLKETITSKKRCDPYLYSHRFSVFDLAITNAKANLYTDANRYIDADKYIPTFKLLLKYFVPFVPLKFCIFTTLFKSSGGVDLFELVLNDPSYTVNYKLRCIINSLECSIYYLIHFDESVVKKFDLIINKFGDDINKSVRGLTMFIHICNRLKNTNDGDNEMKIKILNNLVDSPHFSNANILNGYILTLLVTKFDITSELIVKILNRFPHLDLSNIKNLFSYLKTNNMFDKFMTILERTPYSNVANNDIHKIDYMRDSFVDFLKADDIANINLALYKIPELDVSTNGLIHYCSSYKALDLLLKHDSSCVNSLNSKGKTLIEDIVMSRAKKVNVELLARLSVEKHIIFNKSEFIQHLISKRRANNCRVIDNYLYYIKRTSTNVV